MTTGTRAAGVCLAAAVLLAPAPSAAQTGSLTGAARIGRVYDTILDARFDEVPPLLRQTCGPAVGPPDAGGRPHPAVCQLLDVVALWWQIQLDPNNTAHDSDFERKANDVIAAVERWTDAEPRRAEAWFYLGGAYGARSQWRVLRRQLLSAARDGKRIKDALERALALDPNLKDAYFGIGLYHYYADVAPAAAKVLRFLLFLPGGNKDEGMREMRQARDGGQLLRSEADYQLHLLYLWYEHQPQRARALITGLRERYPHNPHFPQVLAEIDDTYLHDDTASLRSWEAMLTAATSGQLELREMAVARARLGMAVQLDRLYETDAALEHLRAVVQAAPAAPYEATAQAHLLLGQALDRLGARSDAVNAYRQAIAAVPAGDPLKIADKARAGLRTTPDADAARAYKLSLDGWRAFERGDTAAADRLLAQSLAIRPQDAVARYRRARVLIARSDAAGALVLLEQITAKGVAIPPAFYGYACLEAGRLLEQTGARPRAIDFYRRAAGIFGGDARTKDAAQRALARLAATQPDRAQ